MEIDLGMDIQFFWSNEILSKLKPFAYGFCFYARHLEQLAGK